MPPGCRGSLPATRRLIRYCAPSGQSTAKLPLWGSPVRWREGGLRSEHSPSPGMLPASTIPPSSLRASLPKSTAGPNPLPEVGSRTLHGPEVPSGLLRTQGLDPIQDILATLRSLVPQAFTRALIQSPMSSARPAVMRHTWRRPTSKIGNCSPLNQVRNKPPAGVPIPLPAGPAHKLRPRDKPCRSCGPARPRGAPCDFCCSHSGCDSQGPPTPPGAQAPLIQGWSSPWQRPITGGNNQDMGRTKMLSKVWDDIGRLVTTVEDILWRSSLKDPPVTFRAPSIRSRRVTLWRGRPPPRG